MRRRSSAPGPCSPVAKCSESACCESLRMLTPKRRWVLRKESRRLSSSTQMETIGGSRETELKELAVMPWTWPGSRSTVTTVMPVGKCPITRRKSLDVTKAEDIETRLKIAQRGREPASAETAISYQRSESGEAVVANCRSFATRKGEGFLSRFAGS